MKKIRKIAVEQNFAAISVGKLNELNEYELQLGPDVKIPGKVFCSTALGTTGSEFSFQSFAPGTETGFLHSHKSHEELYFFLSGKGEFQVDGTVFPVEEGSVVRVSPAGKRSVRNNGTTPLLMLCIQYCSNTFSQEDATDGIILKEQAGLAAPTPVLPANAVIPCILKIIPAAKTAARIFDFFPNLIIHILLASCLYLRK